MLSCSNENEQFSKVLYKGSMKNETILNKDLENWFLADIERDTIPGISMIRLNEFLKEKERKENILVAVIDGKFDINHKDLKNNIFTNKLEIPYNNIDDDNNGYIDDINGWNFLGNENGEQQIFAKYEKTRIVDYYLNNKTNLDEKEYLEIEKSFKHDLKISNNIIRVAPKLIEEYIQALNIISLYFKEEELSTKILDSLRLTNKEFKKSIDDLYPWVKSKTTLKMLNEDFIYHQNRVNYFLNLEYNDRNYVGDNPDDFFDKHYGNPLVSSNSDTLGHGTYVMGVISKIINHTSSEFCKILPISISINGDEQDKDIAYAIRYAVDMGAEIINISSSKEYSLHKEWVNDALRYAQDNDVLIVTSAGNLSLDLESNLNFPDDVIDGKEFVTNFLKVGNSTFELNNKLKRSFSNYGSTTVDIFAPGSKIYTTSFNNSYEYVFGTSYSAPIVSGIAALIRSYYPSLTASEVKQILMDSGVEYDILVDVPTKENPNRQLPFNGLSKSGKIVNAYNAMLMAEEYVKEKY